MDHLGIVLHGFLLSLGLILPLGPQNSFIFLHSLTQNNIREDFMIAGVAVLSDATLILTGVLGLSLIFHNHGIFILILNIMGFIFISMIGWKFWSADRYSDQTIDEKLSLKRVKKIIYVLSVSLLNPHAILDTIGVIGVSSLSYEDVIDKAVFTFSCIMTSCLFFFFLVAAGKLIGKKFLSGRYHLLNKVSAIMMWLFSIKYLFEIVSKLF